MKTPILDEFISELEEFNEQGILTKELEDRLIEFKKIKEAIAVTHCCKSDSEQLSCEHEWVKPIINAENKKCLKCGVWEEKAT